MKAIRLLATALCIMAAAGLHGQERLTPPRAKVMTLGVFHFAYPNLDAVKTTEEEQISVLDEPYQSEILAICRAIGDFHPTIIAVESLPENQPLVDSLYALYRNGEWTLGRGETQQLGFRIAGDLGLDRIHCVDDPGRPYEDIPGLYSDSTRMARFSHYYHNFPDSAYLLPRPDTRVSSITETLMEANDPRRVHERLGVYLLNPFFEASPEFELVSPLPFIEQAREARD